MSGFLSGPQVELNTREIRVPYCELRVILRNKLLLDVDCAADQFLRIMQVPQLVLDPTKARISEREVGMVGAKVLPFDFDRALVALLRFHEASERPLQIAEVAECHGHTRVVSAQRCLFQGDCFEQQFARGLVATEVPQRLEYSIRQIDARETFRL